jgi:serine phosphatase RsbU (regulator of sigma subunit)
MEIWGGNRPVDDAICTPGLDVSIVSRPLDGAGGDVHYVSLCGGGLITRILLADISGHGAPVSVIAGDLRKLIRRFINTKSQDSLVSRLNDRMNAWHLDGLFATLLVATYHAGTRRLTLSNAGHPRPLLYRAATRTWQLVDTAPARMLKLSDLPLGVLHGMIYNETSMELRPDDRIVLYTDLLIETRKRAGIALGEEGVLDTVRHIPLTELSVGHHLLKEILSDASQDSPIDDVTIIELHHNGTGPRPPSFAKKCYIYGKVARLIRV